MLVQEKTLAWNATVGGLGCEALPRENQGWDQRRWIPSLVPQRKKWPSPEGLGGRHKKIHICQLLAIDPSPRDYKLLSQHLIQPVGGSTPSWRGVTPIVEDTLDLPAVHVDHRVSESWTVGVFTRGREPFMSHRYQERGHPRGNSPSKELRLVRGIGMRQMPIENHGVDDGADKSRRNTRNHPVVEGECRGR